MNDFDGENLNNDSLDYESKCQADEEATSQGNDDDTTIGVSKLNSNFNNENDTQANLINSNDNDDDHDQDHDDDDDDDANISSNDKQLNVDDLEMPKYGSRSFRLDDDLAESDLSTEKSNIHSPNKSIANVHLEDDLELSSLPNLEKLSISNANGQSNIIENETFTKSLTDNGAANKKPLSQAKTNKNALEANALKAKMESIKSKNLERKQSNQNALITSTMSNLNDDEFNSLDAAADAAESASSAAASAKLLNELNLMKEREKAYVEQINAIEEENEKFRHVAVEFERIFLNLLNDKDEAETKLKNEIIELTKERDHLQEDVIGVERAFDDLHRRFEKLKTKVEEFKKNEEVLQKAIEGYKHQLEKEKLKYSTLKKHAEEKLELANNEIEKLRKFSGIELQTLKTELKRAEIKINSLELSVQQKDQENSQLTNLLEDLLKEVKPNHKT